MKVDVFNEVQAQELVDAVIKGHNAYLTLRLEKQREMIVSNGFAWTKSNIIDNEIDRSKLSFISNINISKAGESWEYLEFHSSTPLGKVMFLIKSADRLNQTFSNKGNAKTSQYLVDYAKKNSQYIAEQKANDSTDSSVQLDTIQLQLFPLSLQAPMPEDILNQYDHFLILTYTTDINKQIIDMAVTMPDAEEVVLHALQNLTPYIQKSTVSQVMEADLQEMNEPKTGDIADFGIAKPNSEKKDATN